MLDSASSIVIEGNRWRAVRLLLPSWAFVAGGWFMVGRGQNVSTGVAAIVFFGLCAILYTVMAIRPSRLTLTDEGIDYRTL